MQNYAIAIITNKDDPHADSVIRYLDQRGRDVFRINTEDIGSRYKVCFRMSAGGAWPGCITNEVGRQLDLHQLRVVWLRKPSFDFELGRAFEPEISRFVRAELRSLLETIYSLPNIAWVNNPYTSNCAKSKFQQLILAQSLGLQVPRTLITNEPAEAKEFFRECDGKILIKAIYNANITVNGMNRAIPSAFVSSEKFHKFADSIAVCPVQLQEYVDKEFELRVTVIKNKVMAVKIESQLHEQTKIDWRMFTNLCPHSIYQLPDNIQDSCREFLRRQNLYFGAMDFIVTPKGKYVFLENNPFGQYLWLEEKTGLPITIEMVNLLIELSGLEQSQKGSNNSLDTIRSRKGRPGESEMVRP